MIKRVTRLERSLYALYDAACIWHDLLSDQFWKAELQELESGSCILHVTVIIVVRNVDDLLLFAEHQKLIEVLN